MGWKENCRAGEFYYARAPINYYNIAYKHTSKTCVYIINMVNFSYKCVKLLKAQITIRNMSET